MSKTDQQKPALTQPELPNIPPKPEQKPVEYKGIFVHTIQDAYKKKPDKIRVSLSSEQHPYHIYEIADKLQKILQQINQSGYHIVNRQITDHNNDIKNLTSSSNPEKNATN